jgi:hypothetical protein
MIGANQPVHLPAAVTSCDCGLRCDSRIAIGQMMMHTTSERMAIAVGYWPRRMVR